VHPRSETNFQTTTLFRIILVRGYAALPHQKIVPKHKDAVFGRYVWADNFRYSISGANWRKNALASSKRGVLSGAVDKFEHHRNHLLLLIPAGHSTPFDIEAAVQVDKQGFSSQNRRFLPNDSPPSFEALL
jgi:hypothetical protein